MPAGIKANSDGSAAIQVGGTDVITLTSGGAATFVTSPTTVQAGTAAAPSITFSGDTDTGIFSPGANTLAFSTNGTEDARFDSVGRMLVGTTTAPSSTDVRVFVNSSGGGFAGFAANGTAGSAVGSPTTSTLAFYTAAGTLGAETYTERARFNDTGAFVLAGGTTTANGIGITFPATQSASSNANTLDDYEEGNWTPVVQGSTTAGTTSYTAQEGRYIKIGRQVTVTFYLDVTAATGTGNLQITGLPFTTSSTNQSAGAAMTNLLNWPAGTSLANYLGGTSSTISIFVSGDDIAWQNQTVLNEAFSVIGSHTYFAAT